MSKYWTIISGTNREGSNTLKLSQFIQKLMKDKAPQSDDVSLIDLRELPQELFTPQSYGDKPASFDAFKDQILNAKGIISVLPEYNGSAPGIYKYFIDMLPFPESLYHTPALFIGLSAGRFGSLRSVEQMQQVFGYRNALIYPEATYVMDVGNKLGPQGEIRDEFVMKMLQQSLNGFLNFAERLQAKEA